MKNEDIVLRPPELSESEVRALRDRVFEKPSSDTGWESCKENWMKKDSVKWLLDRSTKLVQEKGWRGFFKT